MQRVQLQLDLDVPNPDAAVLWVRRLAAVMEGHPEIIAPVVNSEMAPPLTVEGQKKRVPSIDDFLLAQGRKEETPMGPWVKVNEQGQEFVIHPEEYDYRSTAEGRRADLERRELGPHT